MNNSIQRSSAYKIYVNLLEIEICRCSFRKLGQRQNPFDQRNVLKCISHFIKFANMINSLVPRHCQARWRPNLN